MSDKKYDSVVFDYFEKTGGMVVLLSEDHLFYKTLRSTILKIIGSKRDSLISTAGPKAAIKAIRECTQKKIPCIAFVERVISGKPSTDFIIAIKNMVPDLKVIVLVGETRRENIAYFYELGVNNVISKPASMNNIIEKLAFTIKPQGKLSEYMQAGQLFLTEGRYREAIAISDKILKLKPNSPAALMLKGDVFLDMGKREYALEAYTKAHESSRLYLEPIKKLANFHKGYDEDQYLHFMKKLDKLSPLNTERKCEIGAIHVNREELEKAEEYFDQAIETATREAMSLVGGIAERVAQSVSKISPRMSEKYLNKVLETKGRRLTEDDIGLFNRLGIALRSQGKWRAAIENYQKALEISPNDEGLYYNMGMAFYDGANKRQTIECFEKALAINPDFYKASVNVAVNMGDIYCEVHRYEDAEPFYIAAAETAPDNPAIARKLEALRKALG